MATIGSYNPPDLKCGDTYPAQAYLFTDQAGTPLPFANGTAVLAQVRRSGFTNPIVYTWSTAIGNAAIDVATILLSAIPADVTEALGSPGDCTWELQTTAPDGTVRTWLDGAIVIVGDIAQ